MSFWTHFRTLDHPKKWLGWVRESHVSSRYQSLILFSVFWPPQNATCEFKKAMIQVIDWNFDIIFCFLTSRKCDIFKSIKRRFKWSNGTLKSFSLSSQAQKFDLDEVDKTMFQVLPWQFEIIFLLLGNQKCDFSETDKAMFQVVARHCELIFSLLTSLKYDLGEVEKAMFQVFAWHFQLIFALWTSPKCDLAEFKKRIFWWFPGTVNTCFAFWQAQNAIWMKSKARWFMLSNGTLNWSHFLLLDQT